jgi:ATP-binding cassette subfamily G (WHITE) protein 2 (PDR)
MKAEEGSSTKSPYTLSYWGQIKLCLRRGLWRLKADPVLTYTQLGGNLIMSIVIGSVFYNQGQSPIFSAKAGSDSTAETTASFRSRGAALFFAILINAFGAALEVSG